MSGVDYIMIFSALCKVRRFNEKTDVVMSYVHRCASAVGPIAIIVWHMSVESVCESPSQLVSIREAVACVDPRCKPR